jgi:hypothetical protein
MSDIKRPTKKCPECGAEIVGRADKKFCDVHCKAAFHHKHSKQNATSFYQQIGKYLKNNRKILLQFNREGTTTIRAAKLETLGFNPHFFTHQWFNQKGEKYCFVFEAGFRQIYRHSTKYYVLVQHQPYMLPTTMEEHYYRI